MIIFENRKFKLRILWPFHMVIYNVHIAFHPSSLNGPRNIKVIIHVSLLAPTLTEGLLSGTYANALCPSICLAGKLHC